MKNKNNKTVEVLVSPFPPLVMKTDGKFAGFEIELWEMIAREIDLEYTYKEVRLKDIFAALENGQTDLAVAGISINEDREKIFDFSHYTLDSGLLVLTGKNSGRVKVLKTIKEFFKSGYKKILTTLLAILILVFILGNAIWLIEGRSGGAFSSAYFPGIFEAAWMVLVTISTVGYGDYIPHLWIGKLFDVFIILIGYIFFGIFIAELSSIITLKKIRGNISSYKDLGGKKVATVRHSTSINTLDRLGAKIVAVEKIENAFKKLKNEKVEAIVFDAPNLLHHMSSGETRFFDVIGDIFERQTYGIAMPTGSPLKEKINLAILKLRDNGSYDILYKKWFGENSKME